jgi:hypothetical protein
MCCAVRPWTWQALCLFVITNQQQYTFTVWLFLWVRERRLQKCVFCFLHVVSVRPSSCINSITVEGSFTITDFSTLCEWPSVNSNFVQNLATQSDTFLSHLRESCWSLDLNLLNVQWNKSLLKHKCTKIERLILCPIYFVPKFFHPCWMKWKKAPELLRYAYVCLRFCESKARTCSLPGSHNGYGIILFVRERK